MFQRYCVGVLIGLITCQLSPVIAQSSGGSVVTNPSVEGAQQSSQQFRQRIGDAELGREWMLGASYADCGIPRSLYDLSSGMNQVVDTIPERTPESSTLPFFASEVEDRFGERVVSNNCLVCHGAPLFGEVVEGLGNEFLDFTQDQSRTVERLGLLVGDERQAQSWAYFADRIATVSPYMVAETVGVNVANNLTFALIAHRDPETLRWSEEPLMTPPDTYPLPVSVPPWWRLKYRQGMFYQGQGRGDHARIMMTAAILCAEDQEDVMAADQMAPHLRQYIEELEPPVYPFAIDQALATKGQAVFNQTCSRCHGRYDDNAYYPDLIIPIDVVGTDPALAVQAAVDYQRFNDWYTESLFGKDTTIVATQGYSAPPLQGVWATAPFLHNGSVPTIALMLDSTQRPTYWRYPSQRTSTEAFYDQTALGWQFEALEHGKQSSHSAAENAVIYDTSLLGYGNGGHQFGDHLTHEEREAVLEYLKTL